MRGLWVSDLENSVIISAGTGVFFVPAICLYGLVISENFGCDVCGLFSFEFDGSDVVDVPI